MSTTNKTKHLPTLQRPNSALFAGLLSDFERLLEQPAGADVHFMIDHEKVTAHRLIVLARCERYRTKKRFNQQPDNFPLVVQLGKHLSAAAVRDVVSYLYTGKILLQDDAPFSLLQVCVEFGLPLLQAYLTHHVTGHLTSDTVCQTLVGALSLMKTCRDDSLKLALKQIAQESRSYITNHLNLVLESEGLLDLSKEAISIFLADKELCMDEEGVWRAVVRWGQHKAMVPHPPIFWSENDRCLVSHALDGILQHVQVMEINSDVFSKEVEPTGLLSRELILERYRHDAINARSGSGLSGRAVDSPRNGFCGSVGGMQEPFAESAILNRKLDWQWDVQDWSPSCSPQDWVLLFRGSRDGFSARDFHSSCDEKGATITIVKVQGGHIFGGYSESSWSSRYKRGKFASSHESFLFFVQGPGNSQPTKYPIHQDSYAINNHPGNGPIFGAGADLFISNNCNINQDSYSQLGHSYGDPSLPPGTLTGDCYFTVEDYEVFGLST